MVEATAAPGPMAPAGGSVASPGTRSGAHSTAAGLAVLPLLADELLQVGPMVELDGPEAEQQVGPGLVLEAAPLADAVVDVAEPLLEGTGGLGDEVGVGDLASDSVRLGLEPTLEPGVAGQLAATGGDESPPPLERGEGALDLRFEPMAGRDEAVAGLVVGMQLTVLEVPVAAPEASPWPLVLNRQRDLAGIVGNHHLRRAGELVQETRPLPAASVEAQADDLLAQAVESAIDVEVGVAAPNAQLGAIPLAVQEQDARPASRLFVGQNHRTELLQPVPDQVALVAVPRLAAAAVHRGATGRAVDLASTQ